MGENIKNEGDAKIFSDKGKRREFTVNWPAIKDFSCERKFLRQKGKDIRKELGIWGMKEWQQEL